MISVPLAKSPLTLKNYPSITIRKERHGADKLSNVTVTVGNQEEVRGEGKTKYYFTVLSAFYWNRKLLPYFLLIKSTF